MLCSALATTLESPIKGTEEVPFTGESLDGDAGKVGNPTIDKLLMLVGLALARVGIGADAGLDEIGADDIGRGDGTLAGLDGTEGKLIIGRGANKLDETGIGDGAGEIGGKAILSNDLETAGVAVGLGVELKEVPTLGFIKPVVFAAGFVFCDNGTKTDERPDIFYLIKFFNNISNILNIL